MKDSGIFKLQVNDFLKGLVVSVLGAVFAVVQVTIDAGSLTFDWKKIGVIALGSFIAYIVKNFLTNNKGQMLTKDAPKP